MRKTTLIILVALMLAATAAFECNKPPADAGFNLHTEIAIFSLGIPVKLVQPDVELFGHHDSDTPLSTGTVFQFSGKSDSRGFFPVRGGRAPARWTFGEFSGPCTDQTFEDLVNLGQEYTILCDTTCLFIRGPNCPPGGPFFAVQPSSIDATDPPESLIITGVGINATYGMPYVSFFSPNGYVLAEGRASSVYPDGTGLSAVIPNISSVPSGTYWAIVRNVMADGALQFVGVAEVYVWNFYPPAPEPEPEPIPCGDGPCLIQ
jgi:hypothetical protein